MNATAMNVSTVLYSVTITFYYYLYLHNPIIGIMYSKMLGALHAKNWDWFYSFICVHGTQMTALWHWWRSRLEWPNIFILDDWRRLCVLPHLLQPISSITTKRRRAPSTHESIRKKAMKFSNYWLMGLSIFHWCPISMNAKSPVSDHYRWSIHLS